MNRRGFFGGMLGALAALWPFGARARREGPKWKPFMWLLCDGKNSHAVILKVGDSRRYEYAWGLTDPAQCLPLEHVLTGSKEPTLEAAQAAAEAALEEMRHEA